VDSSQAPKSAHSTEGWRQPPAPSFEGSCARESHGTAPRLRLGRGVGPTNDGRASRKKWGRQMTAANHAKSGAPRAAANAGPQTIQLAPSLASVASVENAVSPSVPAGLPFMGPLLVRLERRRRERCGVADGIIGGRVGRGIADRGPREGVVHGVKCGVGEAERQRGRARGPS